VNVPPTCPAEYLPTGENINCCYGVLPQIVSNYVMQTFGVNPAGVVAHSW